MTRRIRRYGKFNECPSCHYEHMSSGTDKRKDGRYRRLWLVIEKVCSPSTCNDSPYRHKHLYCEKCGGNWLDCWKEDIVPWWSRWWYRATHLSEQMSRESDELNSD